MKKVTVLLIMAVLTVTFSLAFALPPTKELGPLHVMNSDFAHMVKYLNGKQMKNPLTIYSDPKIDIYIFENFVKWEKKALVNNPTGGARGLKGTGEFVSDPGRLSPGDLQRSFHAPVVFERLSYAGDFPKTGNFGMVLYTEFKDEASRKEAVDEIKNKMNRRQEQEEQNQKYRNDISSGKPAVRPPRQDMRDFVVPVSPVRDINGMPKNVELLKWVKTIVFFDMQHNKMFTLRNDYIDQNAQGIAWVEFQDELDLSTNQTFAKIAHDIAAMLEQSSAPIRNAEKEKQQKLDDALKKVQKYKSWW